MVICHSLRSRRARGGLGPRPSDRAFHVTRHVGAQRSLFMTRLKPFTRVHCGSPLARITRAGVIPIATLAVISELQKT